MTKSIAANYKWVILRYSQNVKNDVSSSHIYNMIHLLNSWYVCCEYKKRDNAEEAEEEVDNAAFSQSVVINLVDLSLPHIGLEYRPLPCFLGPNAPFALSKPINDNNIYKFLLKQHATYYFDLLLILYLFFIPSKKILFSC